MFIDKKIFLFIINFQLLSLAVISQPQKTIDIIEKNFSNPPQSARPWVFWYWMHGAISKEGITADLEAMKKVGLGGAYLMTIEDTSAAIPYQPTVRQLTPEWWAMVKFAMQEAKRLHLQLAMHVSDGFALAGGPWITPGLSMQKVVWTKTYVSEGSSNTQLKQPETISNYYKDIAVYAYPANYKNDLASALKPVVTTSTNAAASFLADTEGAGTFKCDSSCWIQYAYEKSVSVKQVRIKKQNNAYQSQRFVISYSNDGIYFVTGDTLHPPRHGWQDWDEDYTHAVKPFNAKYIRLKWSPDGTEPGSEDLDAAKWKPVLRVRGIYLSDEPVINNYEAKNGSVWRIAPNTTDAEVPVKDAVPLKSIIDLTSKLDSDGKLNWTVPAGNWVIVRIGHTSTGHTNETGGGGKGLECDKFNRAAVTLQFENWFGAAFKKTDPALAKEVLKIFHVDSWECGSQNWSETFPAEFKKRRGYDLMPYLPVMAGIPVENAETSEKVLHDVRETIAELINDVFFATLKKLAHEKECGFSAESVAPTMVSDGMLHYKTADIPMGEFWLNSPTHDKPNDMSDAISGSHIYGKNIIQAESFTTLKMDWSEYPGALKILGDRNFALGINKMVIHVFTQNPWLDKKPGMTLDGVGLYFQRDQTWFEQSKAWIDYLTRCQSLLQMGRPVTDIAVFTGEEVPRRSVLPDRLVNTLPGIFGNKKVEEERKRLTNACEPLTKIPNGVTHAANMADPADWVDPLNGYAYDSFNPDALMMMSVKDGRVVLPGGASYKVLVIPGQRPMQPNSSLMSMKVAEKLLQLVKDGATIIISKNFKRGIGLNDKDDRVSKILNDLYTDHTMQGKVIFTPYMDSSFEKLGVEKDVEINNNDHSIAWTHRKYEEQDIYFIANQKDEKRKLRLSFNVTSKEPQILDPVNGTIKKTNWEIKDGRIYVYVNLEPAQSLFIIFKPGFEKRGVAQLNAAKYELALNNKWTLQFDPKFGGPENKTAFDTLESWTEYPSPSIKYYSGTVIYRNSFDITGKDLSKKTLIEFDSIFNIAAVKVNGIDCGTLWTPPFKTDITKAIKKGINTVEIEVSNTWHNRLIRDNMIAREHRVTWTTAPFNLKDKPLLPAGITGKVKLVVE